MNAKQIGISSKNGNSKSGWLVGGVLMVAAALAITFALRSAPAKPAAEPPSVAQSVPNAAAQGVLGYIAAHEGNSANAIQPVPDAAAQGVAGYIAAHTSNSAIQSVPDASTQGILSYLQAHAGQSSGTQTVPDAATQGVLDYLRAHGVQ